jgi:hypothetical protein
VFPRAPPAPPESDKKTRRQGSNCPYRNLLKKTHLNSRFAAVIRAKGLLSVREYHRATDVVHALPLARDPHSHGVLPKVNLVVEEVFIDDEYQSLQVSRRCILNLWRESVEVGAVGLHALELVLEEGSLAQQRFVLRVGLDGCLGVREEVLELLEDLAGGRGRRGGGAWDDGMMDE